jgi:hypothetical protein
MQLILTLVLGVIVVVCEAMHWIWALRVFGYSALALFTYLLLSMACAQRRTGLTIPGSVYAIPFALVMLCLAIRHLPHSTNIEVNLGFIWMYLVVLMWSLIQCWPNGARAQRLPQISKKLRNKRRKLERQKLDQLDAPRPSGTIDGERK